MPDSDKSKKNSDKEDDIIKNTYNSSVGDFKKSIKENVSEKSITLFIGNGLSRILGYPSWDELANNMLKKLAHHKIIRYDEESLLLKQPKKIKMSAPQKNSWIPPGSGSLPRL